MTRRRAARIERSAILGVFVALALCDCSRGASPERSSPVVRVAAAADLTVAFQEIGRSFERRSGQRVEFTFGSTGLLSRQVREGGPFDVFAAAQASFVDELVARGACDGSTRALYARGRIAVWSKRGRVAPATTLRALADPRFRRVAIANPEHAPYGRAARQALEGAGVWSAIEGRLVYGDNVRHALQFAETGNVEAAIVALSLVVGDRENPWFLLDEASHRPIDQALAVCVRGGNREGGLAFARFVNGPDGRAVMRRFGLVLPGESQVLPP